MSSSPVWDWLRSRKKEACVGCAGQTSRIQSGGYRTQRFCWFCLGADTTAHLHRCACLNRSELLGQMFIMLSLIGDVFKTASDRRLHCSPGDDLEGRGHEERPDLCCPVELHQVKDNYSQLYSCSQAPGKKINHWCFTEMLWVNKTKYDISSSDASLIHSDVLKFNKCFIK